MDTKKKIIDESIQLFKNEGFENTTIPMICKAAKISKSTFYYYFQSKSDILLEYVKSIAFNVNDIIPKLFSITNAYEQLWMIMEASTKIILELKPQLIKSYFLVSINNGFRLFSIFQMFSNSTNNSDNNIDVILNIIERGQKTGEISNRASAKELLKTYELAIVGIALDWCSRDSKYDPLTEEIKIFELIFKP